MAHVKATAAPFCKLCKTRHGLGEPHANLPVVRNEMGAAPLEEVRALIEQAVAQEDERTLLELHNQADAVALYHRRGNAKAAANDAGEIKVRCERGLGQIDAAHNKRGRPKKDQPTLNFVPDINHDTRAAWRKLGALPDERFEEIIRQARDNEDAGVSTTYVTAIAKGQTREAKEQRRSEKSARKAGPASIVVDGMFDVRVGDVGNLSWIADDSVDVIITDPPYTFEFIHVYSDLSREAARVLRPGGSCVVMTGQSYLPNVIARLGEHLAYQWCLAYLTPGGQAVQLWDRHVNTFWKPLLWFVKGEYEGDWIGDVASSDTNDNDKRFHDWGQSESGMLDIVTRFSDRGDTVLDPFCGGGATGVAAVALGRSFLGTDTDAQSVATTIDRIEALV